MTDACPSDIPSELRRKCNDNALYAFGKAYVFEQRSHVFHRRLILLNFLGIAVPILVYGIIAPVNLTPCTQNVIITAASVASTVLLVLSAWSLAANWEQQYSKSLQSQMDFSELSRLYKELGVTTLVGLQEYKAEVARLDSLTEKADRLAMELRMPDEEKRMGMRAALREFQRKCAGCGTVPTDITSTPCNICGNFQRWRV